MIKQEICPYCDWEIDWALVKEDGEIKKCPHCQTRLVGEMKSCEKCGNLSPIDAYYCLHCRASFPV